ncbi:hypothetical protein HDU76_007621, partial [Blyttiomyces sp. JEL0837]
MINNNNNNNNTHGALQLLCLAGMAGMAAVGVQAAPKLPGQGILRQECQNVLMSTRADP